MNLCGFRNCIYPRCLRLWLTMLIFTALSLSFLGSVSLSWPASVRSQLVDSAVIIAKDVRNTRDYPPDPPISGNSDGNISKVKDDTEKSRLVEEIKRTGKEFYVVSTRANQTLKPTDKGDFCSDVFKYENQVIQPQTPTNYSKWDFREKHKCPAFTIDRNSSRTSPRPKFILSCENGKPRLIKTLASSSSDVMTVPDGDSCLKAYIQNCCRGNRRVPNVANYVWIGGKELGFFHFVSFMSALRFTKPCLFLFHGSLPQGEYWDYFISLAPNVILVNKTIPKEVYGKKLQFVEHSADLMRVEALIEFGGFYLDWDEILLRDVDDLRDHQCVMSQAIPNLLTIGFIMGEMNATFLNLWHQGYKDYRPGWAHNSLKVPYDISQKHPDTVFIAGYRFVRPSFQKLNLIFYKTYDWSDNYGIHLYIRYYKKPADQKIIRTLNTTIGAVCRHVLFGDKELCIE